MGIGTKLEVEGASSFNSAMKACATQVKSLQSQMSELSSQFGTTGKTSDELVKRNKLLSDSIDVQRAAMSKAATELKEQRTKLAELGSAVDTAKSKVVDSAKRVDEATKAYGENSKEVKAATKEHSSNVTELERASTAYNNQVTAVSRVEKQYNDASTQVNKMTAEIEDNNSTVRDIERGYNDAGNAVDEFGNEVNTLGRDGPPSIGALTAAFALAQLAVEAVKKVVSEVMSHMKDAVSRFDTLNNFPKVMQQMGYSADDAQRSINKLSEGVDGLPTALDDIVSSTRQFENVTGDLDLATDSAIALNNAILAGGASAADARRGMEQYRQMLGNGTVDAQSWRSVNELMTGSLKRVAESFGYTSTIANGDFYNALKKGDITMQELNARFIELNEGTDGFAEVARTASKGIGTSWKNIGIAITKGLTDILYAVDEALSDAGLGGVVPILDGIKEAIKGAFKAAIPYIKDFVSWALEMWEALKPIIAGIKDKLQPALSGVVDFLRPIFEVLPGIVAKIGELLPHLEKLAPVILGVVTAILGFKTGMDALTGIPGMLKKFSGAFKGFFDMIMAHPVLAAVSIIVGIIAALVYLWNTNEEFRDKVIAVFTAVKDFISGVVDAFVHFFSVTLPEAFNSFVEFVSGMWDNVKALFQKFSDFLDRVFSTDWSQSFGAIGDVINGFFANIKNIWDSIKTVFDGIVTFVKGVFTGNWKQAWEGVKTIFSGIFDALIAIAKAPLNAIIGLINGAIGGINTLISGVKKIKVGSFSINIPTIPKIPMLAEGAVIPPNREFLAMLGDQSRGYNIEAPEKLLREIVRDEAGGSQIVVNVNVDGTVKQDESYWEMVGRKVANTIDDILASKTQRRAAANGRA